jgi:transposase
MVAVIERSVVEAWRGRDALAGLKWVGVDEMSGRKGYNYVTVVRDHDTGRIVWADVGRDSATLTRVFNVLGPERFARLAAIGADAGSLIGRVVRTRCYNAKLCIDPVHVVACANDALHTLRRGPWNMARRSGPRSRLPPG